MAGIPLRVVLPMVARGFRAGRDGGNRRSFDFALRAALRMTVPLLVTYNEGGMGLTRKFAGRAKVGFARRVRRTIVGMCPENLTAGRPVGGGGRGTHTS